jgi:hypothetical protein
MRNLSSISTVGAKQLSPARKRWYSVPNDLRSAVVVALTRELFHFSVPIPRSFVSEDELREGRLCVGISLSSLNLSWSTN